MRSDLVPVRAGTRCITKCTYSKGMACICSPPHDLFSCSLDHGREISSCGGENTQKGLTPVRFDPRFYFQVKFDHVSTLITYLDRLLKLFAADMGSTAAPGYTGPQCEVDIDAPYNDFDII